VVVSTVEFTRYLVLDTEPGRMDRAPLSGVNVLADAPTEDGALLAARTLVAEGQAAPVYVYDSEGGRLGGRLLWTYHGEAS